MIFPAILAKYWISMAASWAFLLLMAVLQFVSFCGVFRWTRGREGKIEAVFLLSLAVWFFVLVMYLTGLPYDSDSGTSWLP